MATYGKEAQKKVKRAMHEMKEGTLKSGKSKKPVTSKKQAIAIGLSEARKEGAKVPKPKKKAATQKKTVAAKKKSVAAKKKKSAAAKKTKPKKAKAPAKKEASARKKTSSAKT